MFEFLSTDIRSTIHKQGEGYFICYFKEGCVPIIGVVVFPTKLLKDTYFEKNDRIGCGQMGFSYSNGY
jgi:hypothetical protein